MVYKKHLIILIRLYRNGVPSACRCSGHTAWRNSTLDEDNIALPRPVWWPRYNTAHSPLCSIHVRTSLSNTKSFQAVYRVLSSSNTPLKSKPTKRKVTGSILQGDIAVLQLLLKLNFHVTCLFLLVGDLIIAMAAFYVIDRCSGLFTSDIKATRQYLKKSKPTTNPDSKSRSTVPETRREKNR